jgi:tetratricopeptide (TPR) repeat protein
LPPFLFFEFQSFRHLVLKDEHPLVSAPPPPLQALQSALSLHREGHLSEAEALYLSVIHSSPNQPDAFRLLGILSRQQGDLDRSLDLLKHAVALSPASAQALHDLGLTWSELADYPKAIQAFRSAIALVPDFAEAHYNLGNAYVGLGDLTSAGACFQLASTCRPDLAEAHFSLGLLELEQGNFAHAAASFEKALLHQPENPEAWFHRGLSAKHLGDPGRADACFRKALALRPDYIEALLSLAVLAQEQNHPKDAAACFREVLALQPDNLAANLNLAIILESSNQLQEAEIHARRAAERVPQNPQALSLLSALLLRRNELQEARLFSEQALGLEKNFNAAHVNLAQILLVENQLEQSAAHCETVLQSDPANAASLVCLGIIRTRQRRPLEAIDALERALANDPTNADAEINLGIAELLVGRFESGWRHYESRWRSKQTCCIPRPFSQPQWKGESFSGNTLLIHAEQGFGDTLQFVRYASLAAKRGGTIVLECQSALVRLMHSVPGIHHVIARGAPLPAFDLHVPLMSLPQIFETRLDSIPAEVPYLTPPEGPVQILAPKPTSELRVGFVWRGSKRQNDDQRPVPLSAIRSLFEIKSLRGYSFQIDSVTEELEEAGLTERIVPLGHALTDFGKTAGLMTQMDLMITMDTAVTHLAGALAIPTWVLLPYAPDWRWLLDRTDCPWYPSLRLFRQSRFRDWTGPIENVKTELMRLLTSPRTT